MEGKAKLMEEKLSKVLEEAEGLKKFKSDTLRKD